MRVTIKHPFEAALKWSSNKMRQADLQKCNRAMYGLCAMLCSINGHIPRSLSFGEQVTESHPDLPPVCHPLLFLSCLIQTIGPWNSISISVVDHLPSSPISTYPSFFWTFAIMTLTLRLVALLHTRLRHICFLQYTIP